jgi:hypothetical protein
MFPFKSMRYPTPEQNKVWFKRHKGTAPSEIAVELGVSRPYVSQAQQIAEKRIERLLLHAASVNRIELEHISPQHGIAVGECPALHTTAYFTYTSGMGVQTWYCHVGNCEACDKASDCRAVLETLSKEWGIALPEGLTPTEMGMHLFSMIMEELGWKRD